MIFLEKTKNNLFTAYYDKKYLHSKYDPIKESENFINKYKDIINKKVIVVYGLGLGYHIKQIIKMNCKAKIYIFEGNEEIVQVCKQISPCLFHMENIKIYSQQNKIFFKQFAFIMKEVDDIIVHKPSLCTIEESNQQLYTLINNFSISKEAIDDNEVMQTNYIENMKINHFNIKELIKKFKKQNKPYMIVAAGPSLDYDIGEIKKVREKFILIAVGASLRTLMDNNIRPDIIVIIDRSKIIEKQFEGFENEDIPLCFLATASRWALGKYKGPKYIFFNEYQKDEIIIETGKTVAVAAINIALKCKANEIILMGQDLAYIDGKSHTKTYEKIYGVKDEIIMNKRNKLVKGIKSEFVKTTSSYILFKKHIENIIQTNRQIKFINCSKGAFIDGAIHIDFKEYIRDRISSSI